MRSPRFTTIGFSIFFLALAVAPAIGAESLQNFAAQRRAERLAQMQGTTYAASSSSTGVLSAASVQPAGDDEQRRIDAVNAANPAVVSVIISKDLPNLEQSYRNVQFGNGFEIQIPQVRQNGTSEQVVGGGSAFFVSNDGLLMTNNHVVSDTSATYTVLLNDGEQLPATVVKRDPTDDVALIKVNKTNTPALTFAADNDLHLAQTAIAIGNALGEYRNTVSVGVVSGAGRNITAATDNQGDTETLSEVIQTDAAINEGNSGGPLLNLSGQVIGMNTARDVQAQNIGFAIPVSTMRQVLSSYRG
ncbi:MAG TPA: trypsin-like peptidase domain-containing protein [Candidatus Peribacteraceae bacterium]|nr:trypsin-like peptidase domain-containing protein [Candidatus Peribacteraceae bacterium]